MANVPVLKHDMLVAHWWPSIIVHCKCVPGQEPTLLLLLQFGVSAQCPHCHNKATAIGVTMTPTGPVVDVAITTESKIALH